MSFLFVLGVCLLASVESSLRNEERLLLNLIRRIKRQSTARICDALTCEHGHCEERTNSLTCVCDKNYTGANCNMKCRRNCGVHGSCVIVGGMEQCQCDAGYEGINCANMQTTHPNNIGHHRNRAGVTSMMNTVRMGTLEILPNPFRTFGTHKKCGFGFRCYNDGECEHSVSREGRLRFNCICKPGFIGDFCEVRCDKKCKNGGSCLVERRLGKMLCGCPWPYSGPDCGTIRYPFWQELTARNTVTGS